MFQLVILVKRKISMERKKVRGALLFDGWSYSDVHYIAAIASYITCIRTRNENKTIEKHVQRMNLVAISPIGKLSTLDGD